MAKKPPYLPFRPGSLPWLAAHQFRLTVRAVARTGRQRVTGNMAQLAGIVVYVAICLGVGTSVSMGLRDGALPPGVLEPLAGAILAAMMFSGLSVNLMSAFATLTDRADLDLLLSAPVRPHRVATARLLAGAVRAMLVYSVFTVMFLGVSIVTVKPALATVFVVLAGIVLAETAVGYLLARAAMLRFGAVRGRFVTQIAGVTGIMAGVIGYQLINMTLMDFDSGPATPAALGSAASDAAGWLQPFAILGSAVMGSLPVALGVLAAGAAIFALVASWAGPRFADDAARLQGESVRRTRDTGAGLKLASGWLRTGVIKEWRSMVRDPNMLSQVAIPIVALIPAAFAITRGAGSELGMAGPFLTGFAVMVVSQIVASLAWVCVSVEEAPDLVAAAPVPPRRHLAVKVAAVAGPGVLLLALLATAIGTIWAPAMPAIIGIGAASCAAVTAVEFWRPRAVKRPKMNERPDRSMVSLFFGVGLSLLGAAAAGLAAYPTWWALVPLLVAGAVVWTAWITAPAEVTRADAGPLPPASGPWNRVGGS
jgi:ABC-2 type transport system permease protein